MTSTWTGIPKHIRSRFKSLSDSGAPSGDSGTANAVSAVSSDPFETGRAQLRDTLKWMIASFGAIGATLALGGLISSLGKQTGFRLFLGILGGLLAFAGVFFAIWLAVKVMTSSHATLGELTRQSEAKQ